MDRERTAGYRLIAQATDGGGLFCRSEVSLRLLDVNDNAPSFSSSVLVASVAENAAPKALLTRLQASDPDQGAPPPRRVHTTPVRRWTGGFLTQPRVLPDLITKAVSSDSVFAYICITRSVSLTGPSLPGKLNISQLFDAGNGADRTDGPTMHFESASRKVNEMGGVTV